MTHRIDIPNAKPADVTQEAGAIVIEALREAGVSPARAYRNRMVLEILGCWGRGEWTRDQFVSGCRKLAILNPALKI